MTKITHIVGIDEVGRGPLAGPVTLCACAVEFGFKMSHFKGIKDSKKLSEAKREEWLAKILELKSAGSLNFTNFYVLAAEIDSVGISKAIAKAIGECLLALNLPPATTQVFLDGSLKAPAHFSMQETIIKGDEKIPIISVASIVAKVNRDKYMEEQGKLYPAYGFEKHKGYGTSVHIEAIKKHGVSPIHRKSFLTNILGQK